MLLIELSRVPSVNSSEKASQHYHEIRVFYLGWLSSHWIKYSKACQALQRVSHYIIKVMIIVILKCNGD